MGEFIDIVLGINAEDLTWWQMSARAVVVFFAALVIIRIGNNRIFGKSSAFDIVLGIIYGSILSRAITGNSPFFPTLAAAVVLVLLHKALAMATYYSNFSLDAFVKGKHVKLIEDGNLQWEALKKKSVTKEDLREALRQAGKDADLSDIKAAYLERSGKISIIMKSTNR